MLATTHRYVFITFYRQSINLSGLLLPSILVTLRMLYILVNVGKYESKNGCKIVHCNIVRLAKCARNRSATLLNNVLAHTKAPTNYGKTNIMVLMSVAAGCC